MRSHALILILLITTLLAGCAPSSPADATPAETPTLVVMTHDSFAITDKLVAQFEQENHVKISFLKSGDAGAALNQAILSKNAPKADVFFGVDNTLLSRALAADIYEPYSAPALANISSAYKLDATNRALPVDYGDICINYDKKYFADKKISIPQSLEDLTKPEYKGMLVVENPATSSPGLGFLLATIAHFGETGYLDYWKALKANGLVVVNGWDAAYYTNFSGSSGKGEQPLVVSYGTSPAVEVVYAATPPAEAPNASIVSKDACFRQIEFVGILKGTRQKALAEKFIDAMLSTTWQEDVPLQMYVFPVNPDAKLPEVFTKNIQVPEEPASLPADQVAANQQKWITAWTEAVGQ
jgi:thiamine transport system substrate-binding protein